jgi:cytochrome c-type biogenesis protein CcmH/NrfG
MLRVMNATRVLLALAVSVVSLAALPAQAVVDCAQCRAACQTSRYPDDERTELRGDVKHTSADAEAAFTDGMRADPGLGGSDARRAVAAYKRAVSLDGTNPAYRNHLAAALLATGNASEAIYNLERAVSSAPGTAKYLANLGYAYHRGGNEQRALVWYTRALALDPLDVRARLFLAYALENLGLPEEALTEFRLILTQEPHHTGALAGLRRLKPAPVTPPAAPAGTMRDTPNAPFTTPPGDLPPLPAPLR